MTDTLPDMGVQAGLARLTSEYSAHNYAPLPVVVASADGVWVTDVGGHRYLDMLAGYSSLNFGHRHPRLVAAAERQLGRVTMVSRAFDHDQFGPFCAELAELCGMEMVLPMNTGAEAVETAIKVARKWGYLVKGVPRDEAIIVAFDGNFHGRTTTIVSFSSDPVAHDDYGPYTPGFVSVPYGDLPALREVFRQHGPRIVAVLVEPIQGEAGVIVPPAGFLAGVRELCTSAGALMIADEIRWRARWPVRSSRCCGPVSTRRDRLPWAPCCTRGWPSCPRRPSRPCAVADCGPGCRSPPLTGARCASGWPRSACSRRRRTVPPSASRRRW